jgi:hypothetical protein
MPSPEASGPDDYAFRTSEIIEFLMHKETVAAVPGSVFPLLADVFTALADRRLGLRTSPWARRSSTDPP